MTKVIFQDLGRIQYQKAWDLQQQYLTEVVGIKRSNRDLPKAEHTAQKHYFLFCEHPPVYTLGRSGDVNNLLLNQKGLEEQGFEFFKINRGGDITYHGLGQIVGYPILDMAHFFMDVHKYVRFLEETIIRTIAEYGLKGERIEGSSGVWLAATDILPPRKICAIGVKCSRWVTMHGLAFNLSTDLDFFNLIVPCGIQDRGVTNLVRESNRHVDQQEVREALASHLLSVLGAVPAGQTS